MTSVFVCLLSPDEHFSFAFKEVIFREEKIQEEDDEDELPGNQASFFLFVLLYLVSFLGNFLSFFTDFVVGM